MNDTPSFNGQSLDGCPCAPFTMGLPTAYSTDGIVMLCGGVIPASVIHSLPSTCTGAPLSSVNEGQEQIPPPHNPAPPSINPMLAGDTQCSCLIPLRLVAVPLDHCWHSLVLANTCHGSASRLRITRQASPAGDDE